MIAPPDAGGRLVRREARAPTSPSRRRCSRAKIGRPVQLIWSRGEDVRARSLRPAAARADDRAAAANGGSIAGWRAQDRRARPRARACRRGCWRRRRWSGASLALTARAIRSRSRARCRLMRMPACRDRPSSRRHRRADRLLALGRAQLHRFFTESFIDELAQRAGSRAAVVPHGDAGRRAAAGALPATAARSAAGRAAQPGSGQGIACHSCSAARISPCWPRRVLATAAARQGRAAGRGGRCGRDGQSRYRPPADRGRADLRAGRGARLRDRLHRRDVADVRDIADARPADARRLRPRSPSS